MNKSLKKQCLFGSMTGSAGAEGGIVDTDADTTRARRPVLRRAGGPDSHVHVHGIHPWGMAQLLASL